MITKSLLLFFNFCWPLKDSGSFQFYKTKNHRGMSMFNRKLNFNQPHGFPPPFKTFSRVHVCDILFLSIFCVNMLRIHLLLKISSLNIFNFQIWDYSNLHFLNSQFNGTIQNHIEKIYAEKSVKSCNTGNFFSILKTVV